LRRYYKNSKNIQKKRKSDYNEAIYNRVEDYPMAARSKVRAAKVEPLDDEDFVALKEEDDSSR